MQHVMEIIQVNQRNSRDRKGQSKRVKTSKTQIKLGARLQSSFGSAHVSLLLIDHWDFFSRKFLKKPHFLIFLGQFDLNLWHFLALAENNSYRKSLANKKNS